MTGALLALAASYGIFLVYTSVAFGWRGLGPGPSPVGARPSLVARLEQWLLQAGLDDARPVELLGVVATAALLGGLSMWAVFNGLLPVLAGASFGAALPLAAARARRDRRRSEAREAWPRLIEEIRIKTTSLGRSIPQAVIEVGSGAPPDMRPAFEAARREWLISTDFSRCIGILKARLADSTADAVCETLLVAHEIGGNDIDRCLTALAEDRIVDVQGRKDARSRQAGARFTRRFVILVPLGMAVVGLRIGSGREAYATPMGQVLVLVGLAVMGLCWLWAGQIMRLPEEERVFDDRGPASDEAATP